jgi:flagellar biogenesis protein FliO
MQNITVPQSSEEQKSRGAALLVRIRSAFSEVTIHRRPRRLKLCESLSLGEKRLVAVIEYDDQRFLVAATAHNVSLLQALGAPTEADTTSEL